jgi:hypothetical protein
MIIAGSATKDQIGFLRLEPVVLNLPDHPLAIKRDALTFETSRLIDEKKHRVARFLRTIGDICSDGVYVRLRVRCTPTSVPWCTRHRDATVAAHLHPRPSTSRSRA